MLSLASVCPQEGMGIPGPKFLLWGVVSTQGVGTYPHYWHLVAATKTCTVGKRAVRILLECFLLVFLQQQREMANVRKSLQTMLFWWKWHWQHLILWTIVIERRTHGFPEYCMTYYLISKMMQWKQQDGAMLIVFCVDCIFHSLHRRYLWCVLKFNIYN